MARVEYRRAVTDSGEKKKYRITVCQEGKRDNKKSHRYYYDDHNEAVAKYTKMIVDQALSQTKAKRIVLERLMHDLATNDRACYKVVLESTCHERKDGIA